jgi:hypothetical protein
MQWSFPCDFTPPPIHPAPLAAENDRQDLSRHHPLVQIEHDPEAETDRHENDDGREVVGPSRLDRLRD